MKFIFICPNCGNINDNYDSIIKNEDFIYDKVLCKCGQPIILEHAYPLLVAVDLIVTSKQLHDICKKTDKDNREKFLEFMKEQMGVDFSHEELMKYITLMDSIKCKYNDNELRNSTSIHDEFEEKYISKYKNDDYKKIDSFTSGDKLFFKNKFRKTFIIMVAATIEILFNDFFETLILKKLGEKGGKIFLSRYDHAGVKECVDICNAFIEKPLKDKVDEIKNGFFDKWNTLRNERNSIIHSNTKYISMKRTSDVYMLIEESILVFSSLKSQVYKEEI